MFNEVVSIKTLHVRQQTSKVAKFNVDLGLCSYRAILKLLQ